MRIIFICFVSIILLLISCKPAAEDVYQLKAVVPFSCISYVDIAGVTDEYADAFVYDTIQKGVVHVFDSIPANEVTVTFFSLLTDDYEKAVELNHDTTIFFETKQYNTFVQGKFEDVFDMALNAKDTLYIGTQAHGCSSFAQKIKIFKMDRAYQVRISTLGRPIEIISYALPQDTFIELFNAYKNECRRLLPGPSVQEQMLRSTVSSRIYMRKGNTIYVFPESFFWAGLDTFKKEIIETNQKIEHKENGWDMLFVKNKKE
ncbi:MAG TPA: hypothetical protein VK796_01240 [Cytophaga sp.]|jgi:hypothetical protein|nr:hypothetical protein [Cytophaga sp.]